MHSGAFGIVVRVQSSALAKARGALYSSVQLLYSPLALVQLLIRYLSSVALNSISLCTALVQLLIRYLLTHSFLYGISCIAAFAISRATAVLLSLLALACTCVHSLALACTASRRVLALGVALNSISLCIGVLHCPLSRLHSV